MRSYLMPIMGHSLVNVGDSTSYDAPCPYLLLGSWSEEDPPQMPRFGHVLQL